MTGKPSLAAKSMPSFRLLTSGEPGRRGRSRHRVLEQQAIFGFLDSAELRADQLHVVFFEHAAVGQFDCQIQRRLSADRGQKSEDAGSPLAVSISASRRMISSRYCG